MSWKEKEREAYYKMANDLAWGACFECCDFENMLEKTADHFFAVMEMREKEIWEQAMNEMIEVAKHYTDERLANAQPPMDDISYAMKIEAIAANKVLKKIEEHFLLLLARGE